MNKQFTLISLLFVLGLSSPVLNAQEADNTAPADSAVEPAATKPAPARTSKQMDNLDLDATVIKGNAELPKVLYIVPWQNASAGDLDGRPVDSLLDDVFSPVDRDAFLRHVDYFGQLSADPVTDGAQ